MSGMAMRAEKKAKHAEPQPAETSVPGWGADGGGEVLQCWADASSSLLRGISELTWDWVGLSQSRLQAAFDGWNSMTACRTPEELLKCHQALVLAAMSQSVNEASNYTSRMLGLLADSTAAFTERSGQS